MVRNLLEVQEAFEEVDKIIIYGCGGHARSMVNVIRGNELKAEVILVDQNAKKNEMILGCNVRREYRIEEEDAYIIAIGDNQKRSELYSQLKNKHKGRCISLLSIYSQIGLDSQIGCGTYVASNAYIGPEVKIGSDTIINTGSIIEHEVHIGDHTHIAPRVTICGRASVGNNVFCGAGSTIIDNIYICDKVIIGAGAVVKEDIVESGTYVGVPARRVDKK